MEGIESILFTIGTYLFPIGVFLLILAYQKSNEIEHTRSKGQLAEGLVIEMRDEAGNPVESFNNHALAPVVEFHTPNGKFIHYSSTFQNPSPYKVGQTVKIYYYIYKSNRHFALEDDQTGLLPGKLFRWGIVCSAIGFPFIVMKLSKLMFLVF